jgi:hypothetical protein
METESGAKIAIRGKGSVKEGKGRSDAAHSSNQEEDLHCLIMADTEDKVNKAKKLIHNVIETVRNERRASGVFQVLTAYRLRLFPKAKTSSSVTSSENLLPSTEHSVTMRTRLARTADRLVIGNMIVLRNRTTLRTSSVVSAAMPAIWLVIVLTGSVVRAGAMMVLVVLGLLRDALVGAEMWWIASTR